MIYLSKFLFRGFFIAFIPRVLHISQLWANIFPNKGYVDMTSFCLRKLKICINISLVFFFPLTLTSNGIGISIADNNVLFTTTFE